MKVQVHVKNADRAKRSVSALTKRITANYRKVLVGVQKGSGSYEDGTPIAVVAAVNHFGSPAMHIPERPFLDVAILNHKERYAEIAKKMIPQILRGKASMNQVLDAIGSAAVGDVQEYIIELRDPPNSPATIKKKKSDNPLNDKGHLRNSIRHEIARGPVEEGL